MAKIKLTLCGILWLCCLFVVISSSTLNDSESDQLENSNPSPNPNPSEDSKCSFKCEDFKALENDNRQLKKSHAELIEKFELLSLKFDQLESRISEDSGIWLLTPPLRGPPGKDGKQGEKGPMDPRSLQSCSDAMEFLPSPRSQKQNIYPDRKANKVEVLCDFETDGSGWTIIQKRTSGPKDEFRQNWSNYTQGFGSLDGNFWLGLENIRALTTNGDQELRIQLEDFEGEKKWAKYLIFSISDASDFYRLTISGFSGDSTLQDSVMVRNNGQRFSTIDKDNDNWNGGNCAKDYGAGWWFGKYCGYTNLNGLYFEKGETVPYLQGIRWDSWKGLHYSLAKSEMKIRKKKP